MPEFEKEELMRRLFASSRKTTDAAVLYATRRSERELARQNAALTVAAFGSTNPMPLFGTR